MAARSLFDEVALELGLSQEDRERLLGNPEEQLDHLALFLAIYEMADDLLGRPEDWLKAPNRNQVFGGRPPLTVILESPQEKLRPTYQYLQGTSGGWA